MESTNFQLDDIVDMKKSHACGSNKWRIIRLGADIRIKCEGCSHSVLMPRNSFEKKVKKVTHFNDGNSIKPKAEKSESINFSSLGVPENVGKNNKSIEFKGQSDLNKLGYKITGLSREQRWNILVNLAIPKLGLQNVVNTISSLIKNRHRQENGSNVYKHAITEWKYDLERLKSKYQK